MTTALVLTRGLREPWRAHATETGDEGPCGFPRHTEGFRSQPGKHQTDLDYFPAGTCRRTGTATHVPALMAECLYDNAPSPVHVRSQQKWLKCLTQVACSRVRLGSIWRQPINSSLVCSHCSRIRILRFFRYPKNTTFYGLITYQKVVKKVFSKSLVINPSKCVHILRSVITVIKRHLLSSNA